MKKNDIAIYHTAGFISQLLFGLSKHADAR